MNIKEKVLEILENSRGKRISGAEIAVRLGVSRNAVWKAVNSLKADGHIIESETSKGYILSDESDIFTARSVEALLGELNSRFSVTVADSVDSTNSELKRTAEKGGKEGEVLIAKTQTNGRGRLGRSFYSPDDTGLYMSILLRPLFSAEKALYITTAAAAAVSEAIDAVTGRSSEIKWVNDIYLDGKKVCGILTEASIDFESGGLQYAVLGIGVNVSTKGFPEELKNIASDIGGNRRMLPILSAEIIRRFSAYYDALGTLSFLGSYRERSLLIGKEISFEKSGKIMRAKAVDIDEKARLVVVTESGERLALSSGEVSLLKDGLIK